MIPGVLRRFLSTLLLLRGLLAEPVYSVAVIPPPSGLEMVTMQGINDSGQVTGYGQLGITTRVFIATPSGSTIIPLPNGITGLYGVAINNSGQVACDSSNNNQPFLCTASGATAIPLPNGWTSAVAHAINESGVVAGAGNNSMTSQDFIGTISGSTAIPQIGGASAQDGNGINNLGQAVGDLNGGPEHGKVFIGTVSSATPVPSPSGWCCAIAFGINDSGQVVANGCTAAGHSQAFISTVTGSAEIPLPPRATTSSVTFGAINNSGAVVGYSDAGGWIWTASRGTETLGDLAPRGWHIIQGISISNEGLILATGFQNGATQYLELVPTGASLDRRLPHR
jgi:hypothetical protein